MAPPIKLPVLRACRNTAKSLSSISRCIAMRSTNGMLFFEAILCVYRFCDKSENSGRIADHNAIRRYVLSDYTASAYNGVFANCDIREDCRSGSDRGSPLDNRRLYGPVAIGLKRTFTI